MNVKNILHKHHSAVMIVCLCVFLFMGVGMMIYPLISSMYMDSVRSAIQTEYLEQISGSDTHDLEIIRNEAHAYNKRLSTGELSLLEPVENGYFQQMVIPGIRDIMAYIDIPKINVSLPVYHGIDQDVLASGCGHMPQSSLPVGGESTHSVLSAHTGMANAAMFSDLPLLEPGDTFFIRALGETMTYEIQSPEDIRTVLPVEVNEIQIKNGQDLCTLVTCVPFGINTHRLLVTGHRIPNALEEEDAPESTTVPAEKQDSIWQNEYIKSLKIGAGIIALICTASAAGVFFVFHRKGKFEK